MSPHEYFYILSAVQIYNNFNFLQYLATDPSVSSKLFYTMLLNNLCPCVMLSDFLCFLEHLLISAKSILIILQID